MKPLVYRVQGAEHHGCRSKAEAARDYEAAVRSHRVSQLKYA